MSVEYPSRKTSYKIQLFLKLFYFLLFFSLKKVKLHVFTDLPSHPDNDQINLINNSASKTPPASKHASSFFDEESNTINNEFTTQMAHLREKLKTFNNPKEDEPVEIRYRVTNESPEKRRSTSRSRRDSSRVKSGFISAVDIQLAMGNSLKSEDEVEVVNEFKEIPPVLPSSVPPPLSMIHAETSELQLPWHKKHEYRPISKSFLDDLDTVSFKEIEVVSSSDEFLGENLAKLSKPSDFYPKDEKILSKSTDDLLHPDVDGLRKSIRSMKNKGKKNKIYSSTNSLLQLDESLYENLNTKSLPDLTGNLDKEVSIKKPLPLPRVNSIKDISAENRNSKTLTFVLDKEKDEFVLEEPIKPDPSSTTAKRPSFVFNTYLSTKKSNDDNIYETLERYTRPAPPPPIPIPQSEIISIKTPVIRNKPIHQDSDYFQPIEKLDFKINTTEVMPTTNERRSGFFRLNRKKKGKEKEDFNRSTFYGDETDFDKTEIVHYRSNENLSNINPPRMSTFKNYKVAVDFNDCLDSEDDRKICVSFCLAFFLFVFVLFFCCDHLRCFSFSNFLLF